MVTGDLRELLKVCISNAGTTTGEIAHSIGMSQATLYNMLSGTSSVSVKAFCGIICELKLRDNVGLLRLLLTIYIEERLDVSLIELFQAAGWVADPGVAKGIDSAAAREKTNAAAHIYNLLCLNNAVVGRRRLLVLRTLMELSEDDKYVPNPLLNGQLKAYSQDSIRKDLLKMRELELVHSRKRKMKVMSFGMEGRMRPQEMLTWRITKGGEALLKKAVDVPT